MVAGIEARGFVVAAAVAYCRLGCGIVPVRKAGKLPRADRLGVLRPGVRQRDPSRCTDAFVAGQRVLVVDDVLATGGTAAAALELVADAGGTVVGFTTDPGAVAS